MRGAASFVRDREGGRMKGNVQVKISNYYDEKEAFAFHHFTDAYEKAEE